MYRLFPDEDPTTAMASFLARFIFALFDQQPVSPSVNIVNQIKQELLLPNEGF